ncbi:MAG TPA: IclR family transcriptional regulator, partial [Calditerricola sp.]
MARKREGNRIRMESLETLDRALRVLKALPLSPRGATVSELAAATGINRTTTMRILVTLQDHGLVTWDADTGRYSLGMGILELASGFFAGNELVQVALPCLEALRDASRETVSLYVRDGTERVCVQRVESLQPVRISVALGQRLPLYRGASGKLLLAYLREDQREAILERVPLDAASRDRLRAELVAIRQAGYATSFGERQPEIASLAVPVRRRSGT